MLSLSRSEVEVLHGVVVNGQHRLASLAEATGLSLPRVSQIVTNLKKKGVLEKRRAGRSLRVALSSSTLGNELTRVLKLGEVDPREVLPDSRLPILVVTASKRLKKEDLARETGLSNETVRKRLADLVRLGVVKREGPRYSLSATLPHLKAFVQEWGRHVNRRALDETAPGATLVWEVGNEFIFAAPLDSEPKAGFPTALSGMYDFGIELVVGEKHYHYIPWREALKPEDIALDTVLVYPTSTRMLTVALVFLEKVEPIDRDYLVGRADELGLGDTARDILQFLDGKAVLDSRFPTREEVRRLQALYGVSV